MARGRKKAEPTTAKPVDISSSDLNKITKEVHAARAKVSELSGSVGSIVKAAANRHGLDVQGLNLFLRLDRMEETRRQSFLMTLLTLCHEGEHFSQLDAFSNLSDVIIDIANDVADAAEAANSNNVDARPAAASAEEQPTAH